MSELLKQINRQQVAFAFAERLETPNCYPLSVFIESTNICNYHCPLCPTGSGESKREKGFVSLELAERVIDEIKNYVDELYLSFYGEPLLHPQIVDLITLAKKSNLRVKLFTNLSVVPNGGWNNFVNTGVDHLTISIDGVTQEQYEKYRVGGHLEDVLRNLQDLIIAKRQSPLSVPAIEVQMIAMDGNENAWPELVKLCDQWGIEYVKYKYINLGNTPDNESAEKYLPKNDRLHYYDKQQRTKIQPDHVKTALNNHCKELYYGPVLVTWDGKYSLCCHDFDASYNLGSASSTSVWEFWNGESMAKLRRKVSSAKTRMEMCKICPALFLENYVIERRDLSVESSIDDDCAGSTASEECRAIAVESFDDLPVISADHLSDSIDGLPKKTPNKREFINGETIDYGSYRTFKV